TLTVDVTDFIDTSTGGLTESGNDIQVNAGDGIDVSTDVDVDVTDLIASNKGLAEIATNNIGLLQTCGNGQVLKSGASNNWACADDDSGAGGWSVSGTYVYNDTSAVTVGIGNNTPITKLAISSPSDQLGIIDSDGSQEWRLSANSNMLYIEDENTGAIPFKIEDGADTDTLIIDDAGHVGIGKTGPTYTLDANGTIRSKPTSGDGVILIENSGGTQVLRIDQNSIRTTTNNDITIFTNGNSGQLFLDQGTGNVGIGNTGPDTELHIQGGLCVDTDAACTDPGDGNVYVEGNATITGTYFGAATDAPDTYIWSISPTYPNYGIYFNEGSPDYIEFKSAGSATSWIALDNGNAQFSDLTLSGGDLSFSANGGCASSVAMCQSGGDTTIRGGGGGDVIVQLG
ncbi:MAG: hypothetical protein KAU24_02295, partial [Candidatus Aenigmarchaeota archaeon]|nr:hypothetical protein [Candidatus Aenigmarchaeota archaeon]